MAEETENERKGPAKDLLLADHQYLCDLFLRSEQLGETRVNWYIGIVTAAVGGLLALITKSGLPWERLRPLVLGAILALLAFGIVTLFRMLQRNRASDGFKKDIDQVRQIFREHFDPEYVLVDYQPFRAPAKPRGRANKKTDESKIDEFFRELSKGRKFGGLAYTVAVLNSVLAGAMAGGWIYGRSPHPLRIGAVTLALSFVAHVILITIYDLSGKRRLKQSDITHAGGVVFKENNGSVEYLIVRPKGNDFEWVLPKGHIEDTDKTSTDTAVREVKEETGVNATVLRRLGTVSFSFEDEEIRTDFFLMRLEKEGDSREKRKRDPKWVSYRDALQMLTHNQSKAMIVRAKLKLGTRSERQKTRGRGDAETRDAEMGRHGDAEKAGGRNERLD